MLHVQMESAQCITVTVGGNVHTKWDILLTCGGLGLAMG